MAEAPRTALEGSLLSRCLAATIVAAVLAACGGAPHSRVEPAPPSFVELVVPPRRAPDAAKPPMLLLLHGIGATENDLVPLAAD